MRCNFLIFGGTTEGRLLAERLMRAGIPHAVSVATKYGEEIEQKEGERSLLVGRMTADEMASCIMDGAFTHVIDATHSFAVGASAEIVKACRTADVPCFRLSRDTRTALLDNRSSSGEKAGGGKFGDGSLIYVDDLGEAADRINRTDGTVLLLTGSRDLAALTPLITDPARVYVRVLPNEESLGKCREAGISGKQIIAMQGPFSKEMNAALIRETGAKVILTKETGRVGGLDEKLEAAAECGAVAIVIRNPENRTDPGVQSFDMKGVLEIIASLTGEDVSNGKRQITLAGAGPGDSSFYTVELENALRKADVIFGAGSVVGRLPEYVSSRTLVVEKYKAEEILEYLGSNAAFSHPVALFSGDIVLYSGAKKAEALFRAHGYDVKKISGISSVSLFANRLGVSLEEIAVISSHGRDCNVTGYVLRNEKTIVLTGGSRDAASICERLPDDVRVTAGCDLGTERENIFEVPMGVSMGAAMDDPGSCAFTGKTLLFIEDPGAGTFPVYPGLQDDEFIRGSVPMTKEEIRAFSIRKLRLHKNAVLYDIGAGTGSVSIEAALIDPEINVYSIEKEQAALELLRQNREKFQADNVHIVDGTAPDAIRDIPAPTHVFIGGSSGGMKEIIERVRQLNDKTRIVINCITPETLSDIMAAVKELRLPDPEIVQIMAGRFKKAGNYHLPQMVNPVYVVCFQ